MRNRLRVPPVSLSKFERTVKGPFENHEMTELANAYSENPSAVSCPRCAAYAISESVMVMAFIVAKLDENGGGKLHIRAGPDGNMLRCCSAPVVCAVGLLCLHGQGGRSDSAAVYPYRKRIEKTGVHPGHASCGRTFNAGRSSIHPGNALGVASIRQAGERD